MVCMQLQMPVDLAKAYKSPSQRSRIITEAWGRDNLYCPRCDSAGLGTSAANTRVIDFVCPNCAAAFQLKSQAHAFSRRIVDSAYAPMRQAVETGQTPHFLILHYSPEFWRVLNLTVIPSFALTISCLEKRKPLALTARRSGWVGCNILLFMIPMDARIAVVSDGSTVDPTTVRQKFNKLRPLEKLPHEKRGWTLDVLNVIRSLNKRQFRLDEIYERSDELRDLHPRNLHVREKIRQQLQRLRGMGLVDFLGGGRYLAKS
jgi:type II restriction enzyme